MNEIIIDDKKYVSSKQAAELTGYAKDYVGQLCREGRVPARLIGRSWYVLASAIQDHKFGPVDLKKPIEVSNNEESAPVVSQTWEAPRYKPETQTHFPALNKLAPAKDTPSVEKNTVEETSEQHGIQSMHEAWKEWFSGLKTAPSDHSKITDDTEHGNEEVEEKEDFVETAEVEVPIHSLEREYGPVPTYSGEVVEPVFALEKPQPVQNPMNRGIRTGARRIVQFLLITVALLSVCVGVVGLGLADKIISSSTYLERVSGISNINSK